jgi:hypothetical protein
VKPNGAWWSLRGAIADQLLYWANRLEPDVGRKIAILRAQATGGEHGHDTPIPADIVAMERAQRRADAAAREINASRVGFGPPMPAMERCPGCGEPIAGDEPICTGDGVIHREWRRRER